MATAKKTASPLVAEATEAIAKFEHRGIEFEVPEPKDFPLEVLEAESEVEIMRLVLGAEQWAKCKATKPTVGDFRELVDKVNDASGN